MRFVSFVLPDNSQSDSTSKTGVVDEDGVLCLSDKAIGLPSDMTSLLMHWETALRVAKREIRASHPRIQLRDVRLLAPVPNPPKFLGIGMNYRAHVAETGREPPQNQYWFNKQRTCVAGPEEPILIPAVSPFVDYEGELGIVIAKRSKNVPSPKWLSVVAGFMIVNDVSVRDFQALSPTFTLGKSFDSHGPCGPWFVTPDEIDNSGTLELKTWVNDELRQAANTSDMIFTPQEMIECLSTSFVLEPGDILSTGTPAGVGMGFDPPRWLQDGDRVRINIEGIGELSNPVACEGKT